MIFEMRTYTLKPGNTREFYNRWAPLVEERMKHSPLVGVWSTEAGALNEIIHVWQYDSIEERNRVRAEVVQQGIWPPATTDLITRQKSEILLLAPFMQPPAPAQHGSLYELRIYTYPPGVMPEVLKTFGEQLPKREAIAPSGALWYSEIGELNRFFQLWPWENWAGRERVRAELAKAHAWPPHGNVTPLEQQVKFMTPAPFSPLR